VTFCVRARARMCVMHLIYKSSYQCKLYYANHITAFKQGQNCVVYQGMYNLNAVSFVALIRII